MLLCFFVASWPRDTMGQRAHIPIVGCYRCCCIVLNLPIVEYFSMQRIILEISIMHLQYGVVIGIAVVRLVLIPGLLVPIDIIEHELRHKINKTVFFKMQKRAT